LKKAIKEDSLFIEAQGMLGYNYDDLNDANDAIAQYNTVIRINPNFSEFLSFCCKASTLRRTICTSETKP
jgi:cytochrome c-type biogenesis protein CcmH/NrfG